jgi:hypothetical protein
MLKVVGVAMWCACCGKALSNCRWKDLGVANQDDGSLMLTLGQVSKDGKGPSNIINLVLRDVPEETPVCSKTDSSSATTASVPKPKRGPERVPVKAQTCGCKA